MKTKYKGFTLAEILVTLTIIAVIAAILFPSILANYNEKTLNAKRKALFGRMSQAFGELSGDFQKYASVKCTDPGNLQTCQDDGSAINFITSGLSSVYKIASACDADSLSACDVPEQITRPDGSIFQLKGVTNFTSFNPKIAVDSSYLQVDTQPAAFMTKNGESALLFYNPYCGRKQDVYISFYTEDKVCVNIIYDLNGGKKKPNKMGQDIGFISVFYGDSPYVVAPKVYDVNAVPDYDTTTDETGSLSTTDSNYTWDESQAACNAFGDNVVVPSLEDAMAIQLNYPLLINPESLVTSGWVSTASYADLGAQWLTRLNSAADSSDIGLKNDTTSGYSAINRRIVRCVYMN